MVNDIAFLLSTTMMYGSPLLYTALGGVMSENSGVVNIGLEGIMSFGAFMAALVAYYSNSWLIGFLAAGAAGVVLALILAIAAISFRGDQTVVGTAINFIGPGLAIFLSRKFFDGAAQTKNLVSGQKMPKPLAGLFAQDNPLGIVLNQDIGVYISFVLVFVIWFLLYRTKYGLRIRACGEHPKAATSLGINVVGTRYFCVLMSGFLGGLGGAMMSMAVASNYYPVLISGQGFIAMAAMIFGRWKPQGALGACMLFGFSNGLTVLLGSKNLQINGALLNMLPYVITLIVLVFTSKNSAAPAADGVPLEETD